ncbi:MAG: bifunctional pyr operon transcriptional regulator/uracil phosphoribosyltransferase PyrR [Thermodesulfobacteriota bacterium]
MEHLRRSLMSCSDIDRSLHRIALEILERNHGGDGVGIIGIHTGGVYLADRLTRILQERENITIPVGSLDITLYRDDWSLIAQNPIVKKTDITFSVENRTIILVDDVIFTGRTIRAALDAIMDFGRPRFIQLVALIDRGGRELPIQPDYVGMQVSVGANEHVHVLLEEDSECDEVVIISRGNPR